MYTIEAIPVQRGIGPEPLTYFSRRHFPSGSIISVPIRKKTAPALVIRSAPLHTQKFALRSSEFPLRPIRANTCHILLPQPYLSAMQDVADYCAGSLGATLSALLPAALLSPDILRQKLARPDARRPSSLLPPQSVLAAAESERIEQYRSLVREAFARKRSVLLLVPHIELAERLHSVLSRGIERYAFVLHADFTKKEQAERIKRIRAERHPILLVATGQYLSVPRHDIGCVIVEHERASAYRGIVRPYIDMRVYAERLSRHLGARLIIADFPLRIETMYRHRAHEFDELSAMRQRPNPNVFHATVDMRTTERGGAKTAFTVIGQEIRDIVSAIQISGEHCFILTSRKGLAPLTVCRDCGATVVDEETGAPMALYSRRGGNVFVSRHTGAIRNANGPCRTCGSWNLIALGIGIERVAAELARLFPAIPVFRLDRDTAPTRAKARRIAEAFRKTPGSVLVGTEAALAYLPPSLPYAAVASLDSLLSLSEWRINERVFGTLAALESKTEKAFVVQTRMPDHPALACLASGSVDDFYQSEISRRERFGYPPFSVFITVSGAKRSGRRAPLADARAAIERAVKKAQKPCTLIPISRDGADEPASLLLKVPRGAWPEEHLLSCLRSLPPFLSVKVDPESLFS